MKGKAAPEIVDHVERLLHPLKRTNPKGAEDPGWQRITWDEALDTVAARLLALAQSAARRWTSRGLRCSVHTRSRRRAAR